MSDKKVGLGDKLIQSVLGGAPNGSDDTWLFTKGQIKKLIVILGVVLSTIVGGSTWISFIRDLPLRVDKLEESSFQTQKDVAKNGSELGHVRENLTVIREDLGIVKRYILRSE